MKKNIWFLLTFVVVLAMTVSSCDDSESYADKVKRERKQINALISDENISVADFPSDSAVQLNTFYKDPKTGVYFRITDFGDQSKMASKDQPRTIVYYRMDSVRFLSGSTYSYYDGAAAPRRIQYGTTDTYISESTDYDYYYVCPAAAVPLAYVGKGGTADLIIPFSQGSSYQQYNYVPAYMRRLKYTQFD